MQIRKKYISTNIALIYICSVFLGQGVSYDKVYLFHIASCLMFIPLILNLSETKQLLLKYQKAFAPILIFLLYCLISISWNKTPNTSLSAIFQLIISLSVLILLPLSLHWINLETGKKLAIFLVLFHIGLSLLETVNLLRWPLSPYSPWKDFFKKTAMQDYSYLTIKDTIFAPSTSFFWNPNNAALINLIVLPFMMNINGKIKYLGVGAVLILIYFSEAKSIIFFSALMLLIYFFQHSKWIMFLPVTGALIIWNVPFLARLKMSVQTISGYASGLILVLKDFIGISAFNDLHVMDQVRERIVLIFASLKYLKGHILFGTGLGFLGDKTYFYEERFLYLSSIHNFWFEILVELGLFGLLFMLCLLAGIFTRLIKVNGPLRKPLLFAFVFSLLALPVLSTPRYFITYFGFIGFIIYYIYKNPINSQVRKSDIA